MNGLKRTSPAVDSCRRMGLSDSGMACECNLKRAKSARRNRLDLRRQKSSGFSGGDRKTTGGDDHCSKKRRFQDNDCSKKRDWELSPSHSSSSENDVISRLRDDSRSVTCSSHGSMSVIGRRREMEDAVRVELKFLTGNSSNYDFFGVYDGHGGSRVAHACRDRLHRLLVEEIEEEDALATESVDWKKVMVACFEKMDEEVSDSGKTAAAEESTALSVVTIGSTAVVAVVGEEEVVVANCGDSRAVLSRGGVAVSMSDDHKPERPDELERIEGAGGRVINWHGHRVLGVLATSRSIGDQYLKPFVIPKPEVRVSKRTSADEFLILATDGLWDVVSNDIACQVVRRCLDGKMKRRRLGANLNRSRFSEGVNESRAAQAAAVLTELAIARGSRDNISVVVVELNNTGKYRV